MQLRFWNNKSMYSGQPTSKLDTQHSTTNNNDHLWPNMCQTIKSARPYLMVNITSYSTLQISHYIGSL